MEDQVFTVYREQNVTLEGDIRNGCLHLDSFVYGDDYDSEQHYIFSKEETDRLFSLMSLDEFLDYCRSDHLLGLDRLLKKHQIKYRSFTY